MAFNNDVPSAANQISADITAINANWELVAQIASGTKMLFYADTAPTGWTIDTTPNDGLCFITNGSNEEGQTGGAAHSTGTWTQPTHTHGNGSYATASHVHQWYNSTGATADEDQSYNSAGTATDLDAAPITKAVGSDAAIHFSDPAGGEAIALADSYTSGTAAATSGTSGTGSTANTWRPKSYCFIICSRD